MKWPWYGATVNLSLLQQPKFLLPQHSRRGFRLDAVLRFDHLEDDLFRLPPITAAIRRSEALEPLRWLNQTSHPPWQELCTSRLAAVSGYRYRADLALCQSAGLHIRHV